MKARTSIGAILLAAGLCLPGCWDENGQITLASIREFWLRGARPGMFALPAFRRPPVARLPEGPVRGTLHASRAGKDVIVEVALADIPERVRMVAAGLKLSDGTVVYPKTVLTLPQPAAHRAAAPRVDFSFRDGKITHLTPADPTLCLRITYALEDEARSANRSTFTLVLGDPDTSLGCRMGLTTGVSTRDGGPLLLECIGLDHGAYLGPIPPQPPAPRRLVPVVTFRFREPHRPTNGETVWMTPVIASVSPDLPPPHRAVAARTPRH